MCMLRAHQRFKKFFQSADRSAPRKCCCKSAALQRQVGTVLAGYKVIFVGDMAKWHEKSCRAKAGMGMPENRQLGMQADR